MAAAKGGAERSGGSRGFGAGRILLWSLAAISVLLFVLYLLRGILLAPWLSGLVERTIEQRTGVHIKVGKIDGSWVGGIGFRNVRTVRPGGSGPIVSLEIDKLSVGYSPAALFKGVGAFVGSALIDIDGARVSVNLAPPPGGKAEERAASRDAGSAESPLPRRLPALHIRALDLTAERPGLVIRAGGIFADTVAAQAPGRPALTLGAASLTVRSLGVAVGPVPLAATLRAEGSGLQAAVSIPDRGLRGTIVYEGGALDAQVVLEAVALGAAGGMIVLPDGTVSGTLSGEARVQTGAGREPVAGCSVILEAARVRGVPLERLVVEADLESGALRVGKLEASSGPNRIALDDAVVPVETLRAGDPAGALRAASGSFSARLGDIPALLALVGRPLTLPGKPPAHQLEFEGSLVDGVVALTAGRLALPQGGVRFKRLRAVLPVADAPWSSTRIETEIDVDLPDVALLNRLLPLPKLAGALKAGVVFDGTPRTLKGSLRATARRLAVAGRAIGDLDLVAEADAGRVLVRTAKLSQRGGANRLSVEHLVLPAAAIADRRWQALLSGASGDIVAALGDVPSFLALAGLPPGRFGSTPPSHLLRLAGRIAGGAVALSSGDLVIAGGSIALSRGSVTLPAAGRPWGEIGLDLAAEADLPDLAPLAALFSPHPLAGKLHATVAVRGSVADPAGTLSVRGEEIAFAGLSGIRVALSAEGGRDRISVANLDLGRGADFCTASGAFSPARGRLEPSSVRFRIAQASAYAGFFPAGWPAVFGRVEGELSVSGTIKEPEGSFTVALDDVLLGTAGALRGRLSGRLSGGGIAIERLTLEAPQGNLALAGRLEREGKGGARLLLDSLLLRRGAAEARLAHPALLRYDPSGSLTTDELRLEGPQGSLTVSGNIAPGGDSDLSFSATGLGTDGWLQGLLVERVAVRGLDLRGRVAGSRTRPVAHVEGTLAALSGADVPAPLAGRFDLSYTPGALTVAEFEWTDGNGLHASATGRLPLDPFAGQLLAPGALDLSASLRVGDLRALSLLLPETVALRGALEADLTLGGSWDDPAGELDVRATQAAVSGIAALEGGGPFSGTLAAVLRRGAVDVRSFKITADELTAEAAGSWTGLSTPGQLLHRDQPLRTGTLALRGSFTVQDLGLFRALAGNPRRLEGRLGGDFTVTGPAADPSVDAEVRLDGGTFDYGGRIPPLERMVIVAKVTGKTARFVQASAEAAGAPFHLGGEISWGGGGLRLDLSLKGENLLLYRDERLTARADLDVQVHGPLAKLRLEGSVLLQNSVYSRTVSLRDLLGAAGGGRKKPPSAAGPLFTLRNAPWRDLEFDLRIGAGSPVVIKSNIVRGAVRPELALTGTGLLPVLAGDIFVDPTRVSLPGGTLGFERGIVTYPAQGAGEPRIDLAGSTRLLGYNVTVRVAGTLSSPQVTLTSVPPLSNEDLLLLVLAGTPPGTADTQAMTRILEANLARYIAQNLIGTVTGVEFGESDFADRIEVQIGRNVTRSGTATIETSFRLLGGKAPTGATFNLIGGTDIYDAYTMGVTLVFRFP